MKEKKNAENLTENTNNTKPKTMSDFLCSLEQPFFPQCCTGGSCRERGFNLNSCPGCKYYLEMIDAMLPTVKNGCMPNCKPGDTLYSLMYDPFGRRWTILEYEVSRITPQGTIWVDQNSYYNKLVDQFDFMMCFDRETAEYRVRRLNRYERARRTKAVLDTEE